MIFSFFGWLFQGCWHRWQGTNSTISIIEKNGDQYDVQMLECIKCHRVKANC